MSISNKDQRVKCSQLWRKYYYWQSILGFIFTELEKLELINHNLKISRAVTLNHKRIHFQKILFLLRVTIGRTNFTQKYQCATAKIIVMANSPLKFSKYVYLCMPLLLHSEDPRCHANIAKLFRKKPSQKTKINISYLTV